MEKQSLISETLNLWKEDQAKGWNNPSWWNLLVLWPIPFVLFFCIRASVQDRTTARRQVATSAVIVSHDPPNHDRYGYSFKVSGKQYGGWAYPGGKHNYSIGEQVLVYFDPLNPTKNSADDFDSVSIDDLFFVPFSGLVLVGLPVFIYLRRRSWQRRVHASSDMHRLTPKSATK